MDAHATFYIVNWFLSVVHTLVWIIYSPETNSDYNGGNLKYAK